MPMNSSASLDIGRLERVRLVIGKIVARCPACAEMEQDRKGNNLAVFTTGAFHCQAFPGDKEHNARIFSLVGIKSDRKLDLDTARQFRIKRAMKEHEDRKRAALIADARARRERIISRHHWERADVWEDSPQRVDGHLVEFDPRHFLRSLFSDASLIWTGAVNQSGLAHRDRWRTVADWQMEEVVERVGPMVSPAIWFPGTSSRLHINVESSPYTVLDFDGFDGQKPQTRHELAKHVRDSLAIVRWIREGLGWELSALLWTGGKSIHAWFKTPPQDVLQSLKTTATALGLDPGLIGHPEHPCRLPGHPHGETRKYSRTLWLGYE